MRPWVPSLSPEKKKKELHDYYSFFISHLKRDENVSSKL
jgi:hypothetical protein